MPAKRGTPVRTLVGIVTIFATVMHFTFGCCGHSCHLGGRGECVAHAGEPMARESCCHDHDHDAAAPAAAGDHDGSVEVGFAAGVSPGDCPGSERCHGCHCAAMPTGNLVMLPWSPLASGIAATLDGDSLALVAITRGKPPHDPPIHPCRSRQALHERFLI